MASKMHKKPWLLVATAFMVTLPILPAFSKNYHKNVHVYNCDASDADIRISVAYVSDAENDGEETTKVVSFTLEPNQDHQPKCHPLSSSKVDGCSILVNGLEEESDWGHKNFYVLYKDNSVVAKGHKSSTCDE